MFNFNKFVFGLKIDLDPSLTEPPLLLSYLVVPFFVFICRVFFFFLSHQRPIQISLAILVKINRVLSGAELFKKVVPQAS